MDLKYIKGISDKRAQDLKKSGIFTAEDLANYFPRNYLDMTHIKPLDECYHNDMVLTPAYVISVPHTFVSSRKTRYIKVLCRQNDLVFTVLWFNQPYVLNKLKEGNEYLFYGRVRNSVSAVSLVNPSFEEINSVKKLKGIVPVYSVKSSLPQSVMRNAVLSAAEKLPLLSFIPDKIALSHSLSNLKEAYLEVHNPHDFDLLRKASDRIATEEYFLLISAFKIIKGDSKQPRINAYTTSARDIVAFTQRFPFEFTQGQKDAVNDIFADMTSGIVMNRLLQGDVGSGKTAVALTAMYVCVSSGYQSVFLAPTEVLARQNYELVKKYFPEYGIVFLSGSMTAKEKKEIKDKIKSGEASIVVGTHAILESNVEFHCLNLCVCDEQHRFGVSQRSALLSKGGMPDLLVMSATPIPRTLSLIFYGDLDISVIKDKPKNRKPIKTNLVPQKKYEDMLGFIKNAIKQGRQAYFVCPKIDGDEEGTIMSVTELFEQLQNTMIGCNIALLHGKMKDKDKNDVMLRFKNGEIDAIVSTTVIEVGVDVPNATVMVIYNAERFGLSQLHQLRGRVGRSDLDSYCFLLSGNETDTSKERLTVMCKSNDGFEIAEYDYELRGGGDFIGTRQSGKFITSLGALRYGTNAVFEAKRISDEVFASNSDLTAIRKKAMEKYEQLKDVSLN